MRLSLVSVLSLAASLAAQYHQNMETLTASPTGSILTGQDGFYIPTAGGYDGNVYTYAGNPLGVPVNPNGGANFYAGVSTAVSPYYVREQHPLTLPSSVIHIECDMLCNYIGTGTASQYAGSVSLQDSTASRFSNMLCSWNTATPVLTWDCFLQSGAAIVAIGDPAFAGLATNVWHHWGITIDLTNELYVDFTITNGATNVTTHYVPTTPMPLGNAGLNYPNPTGFRFFTGGTTGDNVFAIDNFVLDTGASFTNFGSGCAGSMGVPQLVASGGSRPQLGSSFGIELTNLPLNVGIFTTGFSSTVAFGSVPLPFSLAGNGFPGCDLLVDPVIGQFLVGVSNIATWTLVVPNNASFVGVSFVHQGVSLDAGSPGAAFSGGGRTSVGY